MSGIAIVRGGDLSQAIKNVRLEKRIIAVLNKYYPGYPWGAHVLNGRANIYNFAVSGNQGWAMNVDERDFSSSALEHDLMKAGGECLERFGLRRKNIDYKQVAEMKRDRLRNPIPC